MRTEKEIRKQFAILKRDQGEGQMLSIEELKHLRRTKKPIIRDVRYKHEIEEYWFKWVLNEEG